MLIDRSMFLMKFRPSRSQSGALSETSGIRSVRPDRLMVGIRLPVVGSSNSKSKLVLMLNRSKMPSVASMPMRSEFESKSRLSALASEPTGMDRPLPPLMRLKLA